MECPIRSRRKIDALKYKMRVCDQGRSNGGETLWTGLSSNRPGIGNGDGAVFVQLALPAIVEQKEGRVPTLLNLGKHNARAYHLNCAGKYYDDVDFCHRGPLGATRQL